MVFFRRLLVTRRAALAAAVLVLLAAWASPLPGLAESLFVRHTIVHTAVLAVAAPMVAFWLAAAPRPHLAAEPLLAPLPASVLVFVVVWIWHVPLLYGLARISEAAWVLEQISFLAAGVLLWISALRTTAEGILALLVTSMHLVLLGTLLTLAPRPIYAHGVQTLGDYYALLSGQRLGGMLMLIGCGVPYLAGGLYLVTRLHGIDIAARSALDEGMNR